MPRLLALIILTCSKLACSSFAHGLICFPILLCFLVGCFVSFVVLPNRRNRATVLPDLRPRFSILISTLRPLESRVARNRPIENGA